MIKRIQNIGHNIGLEEWAQIWQNNIKLIKSLNFIGKIYKMFYRWHMTPAKLSKIYENISSKCWKCKLHEGTFYIWWICRETKKLEIST